MGPLIGLSVDAASCTPGRGGVFGRCFPRARGHAECFEALDALGGLLEGARLECEYWPPLRAGGEVEGPAFGCRLTGETRLGWLEVEAGSRLLERDRVRVTLSGRWSEEDYRRLRRLAERLRGRGRCEVATVSYEVGEPFYAFTCTFSLRRPKAYREVLEELRRVLAGAQEG